MRFLHTADWHIGRTMRGRSRASEFEAVLNEVVEIARDQQVEAMLVCGDIWDSAAPTADTDRLVFETLRQCIEHGIQVVLLAGNHDSPRKLEALGLLSELLGVHVQATVKRPNAGGILTIEGRDHVARIAAVPFIREGELVDAAALMHVEEEHYGVYADAAGAIHQRMCDEFTRDTVNLLLGHVFVNGANYATKDGSERQLHIGQQYGISPAVLPATPQYIALGHIHQPQQIHEAPVPTYYAGSLLQLDFGESGQQKRVVVFDAEPGRPVRDPVSIPSPASHNECANSCRVSSTCASTTRSKWSRRPPASPRSRRTSSSRATTSRSTARRPRRSCWRCSASCTTRPSRLTPPRSEASSNETAAPRIARVHRLPQ